MRYDGCEKNLVDEQPGYRLYHYHNPQATIREPILIVFSLLNTPWVLDLHPSRSFVQALMAQGLDVFILEWKSCPAGRMRGLADYILGDLKQAVITTTQVQGVEGVHLLGVCQGGYFSLCLSALFQQAIKSVIPMVTPIDFDLPNNHFSQIIKQIEIDHFIGSVVTIPGSQVNDFLMLIDPIHLWQSRWQAWQACQDSQVKQEIFFALEAWKQDCPDQDKLVFVEFAKYAVQQNQLINGELWLQTQRVDLGQIQQPILNIYAQEDYLWPPQTTQALAKYHNSAHYEEYAFAGGHVGSMMSERAVQELPKVIQSFIERTGLLSQQAMKN